MKAQSRKKQKSNQSEQQTIRNTQKSKVETCRKAGKQKEKQKTRTAKKHKTRIAKTISNEVEKQKEPNK